MGLRNLRDRMALKSNGGVIAPAPIFWTTCLFFNYDSSIILLVSNLCIADGYEHLLTKKDCKVTKKNLSKASKEQISPFLQILSLTFTI